MQPDLNKDHYETLWASNLVAPEHRDAWCKLHSTHKTFANSKSMFIVWKLVDGQAQQLHMLEVSAGMMSMQRGITLQLTRINEPGTKVIEISHSPTPILDTDVFIWVPFFCNLRWTPRDYDKSHDARFVRLPICIKTKSNFSNAPTEGHVYVTSLKRFKKEWPLSAIQNN